jgi:hypothetical protein
MVFHYEHADTDGIELWLTSRKRQRMHDVRDGELAFLERMPSWHIEVTASLVRVTVDEDSTRTVAFRRARTNVSTEWLTAATSRGQSIVCVVPVGQHLRSPDEMLGMQRRDLTGMAGLVDVT